MINTQDLVWQDLDQANNVPDNVMMWLDDKESLTAKLKQKFDDFCRERVITNSKKTAH